MRLTDVTEVNVMSDNDKAAFVYTTFPTLAEAKKVAHALVANRLAACANIFPGMIAVFNWEGKTGEGEETAMIIKTRADLTEQVFEEVKRLHSYSLPALLVIETPAGSAEFLEWIAQETRPPD